MQTYPHSRTPCGVQWEALLLTPTAPSQSRTSSLIPATRFGATHHQAAGPPSLLPAPATLAMTSRRGTGSGGQPCKSLQSVTLPPATENTENTPNLARLVPPNAALRLVQRQRSCARRAQGQVRTYPYPCCIRSIGAARSGAIARDLYLSVISQELLPPAASLSGLFNIPVLIALLRRASHRIPSPL